MNIEHDEIEKASDVVKIPLVWADSSHLSTLYANQLLISHAGGEFYLVFGELVPPTMPNAEHLPEQLEVKPVARVALSPEAMKRFLNAMQQNYERFLERLADEK